jgi:lipoprotein NlpI
MRTAFLVLVLMVWTDAAIAQTSNDLLKAAAKALREQKPQEALKLANQAVQTDPKSAAALVYRAGIHEKLHQFTEAAADLTKVLALDKTLASAYQQRGVVHFKAGKFKESVADFDKFIELEPAEKIKHWQRGISYYYAGQYEDGRKQFEGYQDFDQNDVENAVWRFMCMARADGIAKAQKAMLKIGDDRRVPMRQVYDLYKGDLKPADVLKAAKANRERFYANLYVGIYYDLQGDKNKAYQYLNQAAEKHRIDHYMWDVARVHRDLLAKELKKGEKGN